MAPSPLPRLALPIFRGLALAALAFTLVNAARELASPGASVAWHLFHVPGWRGGADACLALMTAFMLWSAFGPVQRRATAILLAAGLAALSTLAALDALAFAALVRRGAIASAWPVPLSAALAVTLALHGALCLWPRHAAARAGAALPSGGALLTGAAGIAAAGLAALLHIHAFGLTDYRRPADAIVVLGARAYANGQPSEALAERVMTGVALYRAGLAPRLVMSGGVDPSGVSEPEVMRAVAVAAGVPASAIVLDEQGVSTEASVESVGALAERMEIRRVLAVSHYFHLARIKLLAERRGLRCFTVPADEGATRLLGTPYYVLREAAALAFYFALG